jgi:hypothetical protein
MKFMLDAEAGNKVFCFDFNVYMVSSLDRERERKAEQFVGMD